MSSPQSSVSILLPFYEAAQTLKEAILSIRSQTYRNWELHLLNDGSTDAGPDIAQELSSMDSRIQLHHLSHGGIVNALNVGLERSNAPFIARMDADDICHPQRLEKQVNYLEQNPKIGLVSCQVEHLASESSQQGYAEYVHWINSLMTPESIHLQRFVESPFAHPSVMFRRELTNLHGGYREGDFPEDYELWLRWMEAGVQMTKVPQTLLQWRDLPNRMSRQDPRYRLEAFYRMKFQYLAKVLPKNIWVWGAGKTTRQRAAWLEEQGIHIEGYYDVDPKKVGDPQIGLVVKHYQNLPPPGQIFLLVLTSVRGVRQKITSFLKNQGWAEGKDYLLGA